ncbi:MAG: endonuclease V [Candidatus Aenigmatarchaeota archaeon]|nr:MAG: endonuclease V [Candidatus Aenigmarchaeota archaeon]
MTEIDLDNMRKEQLEISKKVILTDKTPGEIKTIWGFDVSYSGEKAYSAGVVLDSETLELIEKRVVKTRAEFPYIPTFLSFREGPLIMKAYERLKNKPDVLIINGQGVAHPLRAGLATHVGVILNKPTIGIAQKRLVGEHEIPENPGDFSKLVFKGEQVGWFLKTKKFCNPIFVSPGHMISLEKTLDIAKKCVKSSKLPEPLRLAHGLSKDHSNL